MVDLRSCLRGDEFDHQKIITELKLIDETIIDLCPDVSRLILSPIFDIISFQKILFIQSVFLIISNGCVQYPSFGISFTI